MRLLLLALLLAGCATQKTVYLPDGRQGHAIECSGTDLSWNDCYAKAGETCKARGYDVVTRNEDKNYSAAVTQYGGAGGTIAKRTLLIACK
jgi:hypothetical protein